MSVQRPKLLIVRGPAVPADELARLLQDQYEVIVMPPDAEPSPEAASVEAVMCGAAHLGQVSRVAGPSPELDALSAVLGGLQMSPQELRQVDRIILSACGTACHAGMVGEYLIESLARIPTEVENASEFRYRNVPTPKDTQP